MTYQPETAVRKWIEFRLRAMGMTAEELHDRVGRNADLSGFLGNCGEPAEHVQLASRQGRTLSAISSILGAERDFLRKVWRGELVLDEQSIPKEKVSARVRSAASNAPIREKLREEADRQAAQERRQRARAGIRYRDERIADLEATVRRLEQQNDRLAQQFTELRDEIFGRVARAS